MPKALDKTKGAQKRKRTPNNSNINTESDCSEFKLFPRKKKVLRKRNSMEGIAMSKQLASEVQQKKRSVCGNSSQKINAEPRLCGNGKPMPSLAELEAMYTDSDNDEDPPKPTNIVFGNERCTTPEPKSSITNENLNSPNTLKKIASRMMDLITKTVIIDDDPPPPPVIPQKKPKKSGIPYIVGCKERDQVPWAPKTNFCVGSEKYGIDSDDVQTENEDSCSAKKCRRRGTKINISKSIFNAKSDEIADRLKAADSVEQSGNSSPDSNKTEEYELCTSPVRSTPRSFSPLPSTSKNCAVIRKNDQLFNDSLNCEHLSNNSEIEVIEVPYEKIIPEDTVNNNINKKINCQYDTTDDDCCIIIEPEKKEQKRTIGSKDDIYSSIDLTESFDNQVYEIEDEDIENVIAENQAILAKDLKKNINDSVTSVEPSLLIIEALVPSHNTSLINTEISNIPNNGSSSSAEPKTTNESSLHSYCKVGVKPIARINPQPIIENTGQEDESNNISRVVTNFFNQPLENSEIVDLTNNQMLGQEQVGFMGKVSSWMYTLGSIFNPCGHPTDQQNMNVGNDVLFVDDNVQTGQTNLIRVTSTQIQNSNNAESNPTNVPTLQPLRIIQKYQRNRKKAPRKRVPDQTLSTSALSEPNPAARSLGDCPICMDNLANTTVASTMCGHVFCMECIKAAIRTNGKKCPTCRKSLKGHGYHQLFL